MVLGLARRLAVFAACFAAVLVLVTTEVSLSLSARSRLEDLRLEALAVASTLADYLDRAAPNGDPGDLEAALADWGGLRLRQTSAAVFVLDRAGHLELSASTDSVEQSELAPEDRRAIAERRQLVWQDAGLRPAWHVAQPLGGHARLIGLLSLRLSTARLQEWARNERRRGYLLALVAASVLAAGIAWLTGRWVGEPLRTLGTAMAGAYAGARLAPAAPELGPREFRALAGRYNELRTALAAQERESEARAALLALEERARGLERLALLDEASASFAHEIGTPLNTMNGHFQLLREDLRGLGASEAVHRVDLVLGQVERVAGIARAWLTQGSWPRPALQPVDLRRIARYLLEFMEPSFTAGRVSARSDDAAAPPVTVQSDPELVEQILLNLLKNAMDAMPDGGEIRLASGFDGRMAWLTVTDSGAGISEVVKRQLFHPFTTTKGPLGTGLGLTLSRRLARALGGDLVHEPTDVGTRWRLTLPLASG